MLFLNLYWQEWRHPCPTFYFYKCLLDHVEAPTSLTKNSKNLGKVLKDYGSFQKAM